MIEKLGIIPVPKWLQGEKFVFNVQEVLNNSLYYPGSSFYGEPVRIFRGNVHSFVFVDYGSTREKLTSQLENDGFSSFKLIHREEISEEQLTPHGWRPRIVPHYNEVFKPTNITPFCDWMIFENDNKERFSLINLCADAVASYAALYQSNNIKPRIVAIMPVPERLRLEYGWTDFSQEGGIFSRTLLDISNSIPDFLVLNNVNWRSFQIDLGPLDADKNLKVWGRK